MYLTRRERRAQRLETKRQRSRIANVLAFWRALILLPVLALVATVFTTTLRDPQAGGRTSGLGRPSVPLVEIGSSRFWLLFVGYLCVFAVLLPLLHFIAGRFLGKRWSK
jgi:hypothetical protein